MEFIAEQSNKSFKKACFGAGCYWGTEKFFKSKFGSKIRNDRVGFMGPLTATAHPTYKQVRGGDTQQVEVYHFEYVDEEGLYEELVKHFFKFHDPTTSEGQGEDVGSMYVSMIYVFDEQQREVASKVKNELQQHVDAKRVTAYRDESVVTVITDATVFYSAHEEHQAYLDVNPNGYCNHGMRFTEWPSAIVYKKACFGAGCYWGTEKFFKSKFGSKIRNGRVGFMGPLTATAHPTYKQVRGGDTQQVEVYHFEYVDEEGLYEELVKHFFKFHDPTTSEGQGEDVGSMYVSMIYVFDEQQREVASKIKSDLQQLVDAKRVTAYSDESVVTVITDATVFYSAHEEHQAYLDVNPNGYCNHGMRFTEWPSNN